MKRTLIAALTIQFLVLIALPAPAQTIKFGTLAPEGSPGTTSFAIWPKTGRGRQREKSVFASTRVGSPEMIRTWSGK